MLSRLNKPLLAAAAKAPVLVVRGPSLWHQRQLATRVGGRFGRIGRTRAGQSAEASRGTAAPGAWSLSLGQGAVAGGAACGLGALCWYGLSMGGQGSALERSVAWPAYIRQRIRSTYAYIGLGLGATAAATVAAYRSPAVMRIMHSGGWGSILLSAVAVIGSGMAVQMLPYSPGLGAKQVAWLGFSGLMGCMIAPVCVLGGPLVLRAATTTAGIVSGLTAIAVCAPDGKFLTWGGALGMGLGVVFVSSLGSAFLGPASSLGATMYSISMYGGLLLFSGFMLYDTQKVVQRAQYGQQFDPINGAIHIYMDTINIFIRIATMLAGGGNKRK